MRRVTEIVCGIGLLALVGCAGKGDLISLQLRAAPSQSEQASQPNDSPRIAVSPFEDLRQKRNHLGTRSHLWGGESYFTVPGGQPGEATAQVLAEFLKGQGWQVLKPGTRGDQADVVLSGKVLDLAVDAKSGVGSTRITAMTKVSVEARNSADGSVVRMTLSGSGSDRVFWFEPEDAQSLVNTVLSESFMKLLQDTKIENRMVRLK
jgi:hypothetical protein